MLRRLSGWLSTPPPTHTFGLVIRAGTPIPINDVWIAAATLDCGHLLTFDDHFDKTPSVDRTVLPVRIGRQPP